MLEWQDDDERLHDGAAAGRDAEEGADMPAVPGCLGDVAVVRRPRRRLARPALYRDVEGGPPLAVVRGGALVALPGLAGRQVLEAAVGIQRGERPRQVLRGLRREAAAH